MQEFAAESPAGLSAEDNPCRQRQKWASEERQDGYLLETLDSPRQRTQCWH